jgi:hypothetical protein
VEAYRSYPDGPSGYPESVSAEPDYGERANWYDDRGRPDPDRYDDRGHREPDRYPAVPSPERYDDRGHREPDRYDDRGHREAERYDEPRRSARPSPGESARVAPAPRPTPAPAQEPVSAPPPPRPVAAPASPAPVGDSLYRSKRPAAAVLCWAPTMLLEVPALLLLLDAAFGDVRSVSGVISASCLVLALPLLAAGLYAVATGAVRAAGPNSVQAWLRPPVSYLTVSLVLFVAAGLAA